MRAFDAAELSGAYSGKQDSPSLTPFDAFSSREWLTVNGAGGYASGTVAGSNSRRYHGYLVAALPPPYGRMTALGKVEERIMVGGERYELSTNRYPNGTVFPDGWKHIVEFVPWPVPTWTYRMGEVTLVKRVYLARGKNTVYAAYTLKEAARPVTLTLTPLVCWKSYHQEMQPWNGFPVRRGAEVGGWFVQMTADSPTLHLILRGARWTPAGWWHERIVHDRERERGFDYQECLFCPATGELALATGQTATLVATLEPDEPEDPTLVLADIVKRQDELLKAAKATGEERRPLVLNSDQFIIRADGRRDTVVAGYPWFTDWGRDTMIALPGLCLATGRAGVARTILSDFAAYVSQGMIPNRFPDAGETPDYNTVDATLWFVHACDRYVSVAKDKAFHKEMLPTYEAIIEAHLQGTRYGIGVDPIDGLLSAGEEGTNLTWMDAKVGGRPITARSGKPVEINALWINALRIVAAAKGARNGKTHAEMADRATAAFRHRFVRPDGRGLYDVIAPDGSADPSVRPNQIIAAALPIPLLSDDQLRSVVTTVEQELLTPFGLRTLSPSDPRYRGRYEGSGEERDSAYHQGTVWPWLLGAFIDAYRKVHGADADIRGFTAPLLEHLRSYGIGGIAEVFDGDPPHRPNGCPWQAWSVAELLRVL